MKNSAETAPLSFPGTEPSRPLVLAASTGGHLAQLFKLAPLLGASDESLWITFDNEQSRSLLAGKKVLYVPYVAPRDGVAIVTAGRIIRSALRTDPTKYIEAVSTGAGLALAALPIAKAFGIPTRYIESVSRTDGPSLTGKILAATRLASLQTQHENWSSRRWKYAGSVLNAYVSYVVQEPVRAPRIFVTLGTIKPYRFDALIDAILATGLCNARTVWQVGVTTRDDLPGSVHVTLDDAAFTRQLVEADAIITHSGVGSILKMLDLGRCPVVVPRRKARSEHVDDHQMQIARLLEKNKLAVVVEAPSLSSAKIIEATTLGVRMVSK